ncbi:MAG: DUF1699 family protein [Methanothrix sp.]|nr:MAG: DUF1699 family protein [Methanothrix sp.]
MYLRDLTSTQAKRVAKVCPSYFRRIYSADRGGLITRTLNSDTDLNLLNAGDEELTLTFIPTNHDIYKILLACPRLKKICIHPHILNRMPCIGQTLLYMQKVAVVTNDYIPLGTIEAGPIPAELIEIS